MITKVDIINFAIQLANKEIERAIRHQNLMQALEMKRLIRKLLQVREGSKSKTG